MKQLLVLGIFLMSMLPSSAQMASFRNYSVEEGLSQSQVYTIFQDQNGLLWFGTRGGGVSLFDGETFESRTDKDGLVNNYIYCIRQDKQQNIWIGTNDGLSRYDGTAFKTYKHRQLSNHLAVFSVEFDRKGTTWLATNHGIYQVSGDSIINQNELLGFDERIVNAMYIDQKGDFWMGTGSGMYYWASESGKKVSYLGDRFHALRNAITCIKPDTRNGLWIGTYGDGAYMFDGKKCFRVDLKHELYKQTVFDILVEADNCWFGTLQSGLIQYDRNAKSFTQFSEKNGIGNNHVRAILKDRWGSLWIGTSGGGVSQFAGKLFSHYSLESGLGGNFIYSVFQDSQRRIWFGTSQNGVSILENNVFSQLNTSSGFEAVKVKAIAEDDSGIMYFGTEGQGIGTLSAGGFSWIQDTRKYYIRQMVRDRSGAIWVATSGAGLLRITEQGNLVEPVTFKEGLLHKRLTCVLVDSRGNIWYGSESVGLACYDPVRKRTQVFNKQKGLSSDAIRSIVEDKKGQIWVGTAGAGVNCLKWNRTWQVAGKMSIGEGLYSSNVYLMVFDEQGKLILGSESGLDVVELNDSNKLVSVKHYNKSDGFLGVETCQNSVCKDASGKIWFGTINGVNCYDVDKFEINKIPPIITIQDIQLFYESIGKTPYSVFRNPWNKYNPLELPYDQNHISFLFKGINLKNPEGVEYSWCMKGFEDTWSPWSRERRIVYSNLPPGDFVFELKSRNEDGYENKYPVRIRVTIAAPFWQKPWFITLVLVVIFGTAFVLLRYQLKRIKRNAEKAQKEAEFERNMLQLEQQALRLQMNPHFIFNALNSIQGLIGTENEVKARYYLAKFARLMRQILNNSRNVTIPLEDEVATLENYLLIEQFCNGNRFDYEIKTEIRTAISFLEIPPMLIQPFVENSVKHAFQFAEGQTIRGKIAILFREEQDGIRCFIRDNGIGREQASARQQKSTAPDHKSLGLEVTSERLKLISSISSEHALEVHDILDETGKVVGTEVQIFIPF